MSRRAVELEHSPLSDEEQYFHQGVKLTADGELELDHQKKKPGQIESRSAATTENQAVLSVFHLLDKATAILNDHSLNSGLNDEQISNLEEALYLLEKVETLQLFKLLLAGMDSTRRDLTSLHRISRLLIAATVGLIPATFALPTLWIFLANGTTPAIVGGAITGVTLAASALAAEKRRQKMYWQAPGIRRDRGRKPSLDTIRLNLEDVTYYQKRLQAHYLDDAVTQFFASDDTAYLLIQSGRVTHEAQVQLIDQLITLVEQHFPDLQSLINYAYSYRGITPHSREDALQQLQAALRLSGQPLGKFDGEWDTLANSIREFGKNREPQQR